MVHILPNPSTSGEALAVSDQAVAVVVGALVVIALRIIDFYLPKDRISNWTKKHTSLSKKEDDDEPQV